ncbi:MAG: DUF1549 domain-containing protein [Gemmataceae bacterium]
MRRTMVLLALLYFGPGLSADEPKKAKAKPAVELPTGTMETKDWLAHPTTKLEKGEIDRLVAKALKEAKVEPSAVTTDEQFIRRVYLDLIGKLPMPADIAEFAADKNPDKRAKLIDKLLDSDDYSKHYAKYWREVFGGTRLTDFRARVLQRHFELWLVEQFKTNARWDKMARDLITASGTMKNDEPTKNGQLFFLLSRKGADAKTELAAETSRIFLGTQIQCAQCHDHPSDVWKRPQFHEFTAYFARMRERPIFEEKRIVGASLVSLPFAEHKMPDKSDSKTGKTVLPRFLDGSAPKGGGRLSDQDRRNALAESIVSKDNPWFAGAFVNRTWGLLMGQAFYTPIDDMGPMKEAVMPEVLARVSGSFRGSGYDIKGLLRDIMNSETYQRQVRPGESIDSHIMFAGTKATRLSADDLWNVLTGTLGTLGGGGFAGKGKGFPGKGFGGFGLEGVFKSEFGFDPSSKAEDIEGSISQALMLMNNPAIQGKITAKGTNLLARILESNKDDEDAVRAVYLRALARRPTDREMRRCREHIDNVGNRAEAFEDILWALINSTEFQTRR